MNSEVRNRKNTVFPIKSEGGAGLEDADPGGEEVWHEFERLRERAEDKHLAALFFRESVEKVGLSSAGPRAFSWRKTLQTAQTGQRGYIMRCFTISATLNPNPVQR